MLEKRGAKENLRVRFPTDRKSYTSRYDYENDGDLEEDNDEPASTPQIVTEKQRSSSDVVVLENSDTKNRESSDIVSGSDLDPLPPESSGMKGETETASFTHVGKVVVIEDVRELRCRRHSVRFISNVLNRHFSS